jgi:hypothetical protein
VATAVVGVGVATAVVGVGVGAIVAVGVAAVDEQAVATIATTTRRARFICSISV